MCGRVNWYKFIIYQNTSQKVKLLICRLLKRQRLGIRYASTDQVAQHRVHDSERRWVQPVQVDRSEKTSEGIIVELYITCEFINVYY